MSFCFDIDVFLDAFNNMSSTEANVTMICFHGEMNTDFFTGKIMPGGVDTQVQKAGQKRLLSARYMLEGIDSDGVATKIYIENNGTVEENGVVKTVPSIYTDNQNLKWLCDMQLSGQVIPVKEGHIKIHFDAEVS